MIISNYEKKTWLDKLYYSIGKQQYDFYLSGLRKVGEETKSTRWKKYSQVVFPIDFNEDYKLSWVNQRQILPIEIVLDLEKKSQLKPTIKKLRNFDLEFYVFDTSSRGYHVHIFFNRELTSDEKLSVLEYFKVDLQKNSPKTMIALEWSEHWKSGKIKEEVEIDVKGNPKE